MLLSGSTATLWTALSLTFATHHADALTFNALEPAVTHTQTENLDLTMTITPGTGSSADADLAYVMDYRNTSQNLIVNLVIQNPIAAHTQYRVGSVTRGTPPSDITEVTPLFSSDGGLTWNYSPVSGGGGAPASYDANVTHVRFMLSGVLTPGTSSTTGVGFKVRVNAN